MEGTAPLRVLGETAYPLVVASARVRLANYVPFLGHHGIALAYRPALTDREYELLSSQTSAARKALTLAVSARRATARKMPHDLLLVHRLRLLSSFPGVDPPSHLDVYDLDDALYLGSAAPVNRRFHWVKQERRRSIECLRRARLVIAGNSFLAGTARQYARQVEVVPSCVDPVTQPLRNHASAEVVTIGWIGSSTTSPYLRLVFPALSRVNKHRLRAKLVVIGANPGLRASWIEHRPWTLATQASDLASFDIGVMPLPDTEWARGKCGYKLLQYFSAGVAAVASPVGVAPHLIGSDRGLLAGSPGEWHAALDQLIADASERRQRGSAARAFVEREYSYQRWAPELAAMLHSIGGGASRPSPAAGPHRGDLPSVAAQEDLERQ